MLLNLFSNALKFTRRGEIRLSIESRGNSVFFEVSDTGIGVAPESINRLFKLVGRLQESTEINKTGCGIGLYISQLIMNKMGSEINVKSTPNEGTVFFF